MQEQPNILFFFTDDQRFDTLNYLFDQGWLAGSGSKGCPTLHTPHLDALCARGTVFTRAHIPGGTCGAVCMPSRAMLLTGRTLFHLQGEGQGIPDNHVLLGEHLQRQGYAAFGTGKWHNGRSAYARSHSHGDEIFFGGMGDHWNVPAYHFDPSGAYAARQPIVRDPFHNNTVEHRECDHIHAGCHSTDLFVDAALRFIDSHDPNKPFFLYIPLMAPHDPRTMPERFLRLYDPQETTLPENFLARHPFDTGDLRVRDELLAALPRNPDEIRRHIAEYYAMISHLDDAFGRLVAGLKDAGRYADTLIVFAGDNGLALGQHGLMGKQNLYDHSVRVPLVFAGPGVPQGQRRDALVYLLDIFPTLCDLLNIEVPASLEGLSLKACLEDPDFAVRPDLYLAYARHIRGLTDGEWKLLEYAGGHTQLFDLHSDPLEGRDLHLDPAQQARLRAMRQRLVWYAAAWDDESHPTGQFFWTQREDLKSSDAFFFE
jgi:arylsulfatase A-like enzyme